MRLILPNGEKIYLDTKLTKEEKMEVVKEILLEWEEYFEETWNLNKTKVCLEVLSNYLCFAKDEKSKNKEDKEVMSVTKMKRLYRGDKRMKVFSDLPAEQKQLIGLVNNDEGGESNE